MGVLTWGDSLALGATCFGVGGLGPLHSLGDEGKGIRADGQAGHQADGKAAQGAGVVHTHDGVEHGGDGVGVALLGAGVPSARVQDGASVQHQQQHVDLGGRHGQGWADLVLRGLVGRQLPGDSAPCWDPVTPGGGPSGPLLPL